MVLCQIRGMSDFLTFKFAPHILEDLGVNLYTTLPKALVEFVANSHDADAANVSITLDPDIIENAKQKLKADHALEKKNKSQHLEATVVPLNERALPDNVVIILEDDGHGMSMTDLESKFLVVGSQKAERDRKIRTDAKRTYHHGEKRTWQVGLKGELISAPTESLAENFYGIKSDDFAMCINDVPIDTKDDDFAYAWPSPEKSAAELIESEIPNDDGQAPTKFRFRIRFRGPKKQLPAKQRGVRVYAHHRLASLPDLLDVKSSAHGFQYTSYLDGVVVADWIDEQKTDYISTNRQNLRWETPILNSLRVHLTSEMTKALAR